MLHYFKSCPGIKGASCPSLIPITTQQLVPVQPTDILGEQILNFSLNDKRDDDVTLENEA